MKKNLAVVFFFFFISFAGFCKGQVEFTVSPFVGLSDCKVDEILYETNGSVRSLLEWEQNIIFDLGLRAKASINNFDLALCFSYSFPCTNGHMTDSDWENGSKYSITNHPVVEFKNINSQLDFSYRLYESDVFAFSPVIELEYFYTSFNGGKGTGVRYNNPVKVYGIDYYRHSAFIFMGAETKYQINSRFFVKAGFLIAPFCYQDGFDFHHGKNNPFHMRDIEMGWFSKFKACASAGITLTSWFSIESQFSILFGGTDKGRFYTDIFSDTMGLHDQKKGAGIFYKSCKLFINFSL